MYLDQIDCQKSDLKWPFPYMYSNTFAIIEFDIHETIFIFWQSKYILQKYYFGGG